VNLLIAKLGDDRQPRSLELVVRAGLLAPGAVPADLLPTSSLRHAAEQGNLEDGLQARVWTTLALAALREGNADDALRAIRRAQDDPTYSRTPAIQSLSLVLTAMAQYDIRAEEAADAALRSAQEFARSLPAPVNPMQFTPNDADRTLIGLLEQQVRGKRN
jgi:hypothetical protein